MLKKIIFGLFVSHVSSNLLKESEKIIVLNETQIDEEAVTRAEIKPDDLAAVNVNTQQWPEVDPVSVLQIKEKKHLDKINQPVSVYNLCVAHQKRAHSFGEARLEELKEGDRLVRMVEHIRQIAKIASDAHEKRYLSEEKIRDESKNKITRILLNEFSLFTKETPLTETEMHRLISEIESIATTLHENVHLVLGTISVGTSKNDLYNQAIYVQGGTIPQITVIAKSNPKDSDQSYKGFNSPTSQPVTNKPHKTVTHFISPAAVEESSVHYNPIIKCKTEGGAAFNVAISICYDYVKKVAKKSLLQEFNFITEGRDQAGYIPIQRDHLIISNSLEVTDDVELVSNIFLQVDPRTLGVYSSGVISKIAQPEIIFQEDQPVFGERFSVVAFPEFELALEKDHPHFNPHLEVGWRKKTDKANDFLLKSRIKTTLESQPKPRKK